MHINLTKKTLGASLLAGSLALSGNTAFSQHVHGHVEIGIAVEEASIAVTVRAPLSDVIGFEHAPRNDEQTAKVQAAAELLASGDAMFGMPAAAGCVAEEPDIEAPEYLLARIEGRDAANGGGAGEGPHSDEHDHDEHDHSDHDGHDHESHAEHDHGSHDHEEHADHDHDSHDHEEHADHDHNDGEHEEAHASANDDHDHEHDHDHDHEGDGDGHSDLNATYVWSCERTGAISEIAASFAAGFAQLQNIEIQIITASGARVIDADAQIEMIPISAN